MLAHPYLKRSKSLTSSPPRAGFDLDPIQRLARMALRPSGQPGQNDRRYGNSRASMALRAIPTRYPRGPLSPEARSCAGRCTRGVVYPMVSTVAGWCTPGVYPWGTHHATVLPMGYTPSPGYPAPRKNGPLGSMASRGAGLQGIHGNNREYTGITGNTGYTGNNREYRVYREYQEYREYREYPGIQGIQGIHGIPGNTRNTRNTREYTEYTGMLYLWSFLIGYWCRRHLIILRPVGPYLP